MEAKDIKIGKVYDIKVGKNTTPVRITERTEDGGWEAVSLSTEKSLVIKTADRIVGLHTPKPDKKTSAKPRKAKAEQEAEKPQTPATVEPVRTGAKRLTLLDAAVKVLAEAKKPLTCKQMIDVMIAEDIWKPSHGGKTPANTLNAAIGTDLKKQGDLSRFEKADRGQYTLRDIK